MKINTKILLVVFPLIAIPIVLVGFVSLRLSQAAVQTAAHRLLKDQLDKAISLCTQQSSLIQTKDPVDPESINQAKTVAVEGIKSLTFNDSGYSFAVDNAGFVVSHPDVSFIRQNVSGETWYSNLYGKDSGTFTYKSEGEERIAQFQRFPQWDWYVVSSESQQELFGPINKLRSYISILLVISLIVASFAILVLMNLITSPLRRLVSIAERARKGEPVEKTAIKVHDEVGALTIAIEDIANQRQETIDAIEQRAAERTRYIEQHAIQLQTASEIAREAVSTHDLEALLVRSVNLIQERFFFYQVNIYTLDEQRQYAVLRAGSGEIGQRMVQRGYRVRIGEVGSISHVASTGELRVIHDVKLDYTYVKHSLLPNTASAAALPLKVAGRIIGVLNVEHDQVNAFNQDDIAVLQTLADQLAIAIENARLVEELRNSLKETRSLYQSYTQETWYRATRGNKTPGYQFNLSQISAFGTDLPEDIQARLMEGQVIQVQSGQFGQSSLDQPLNTNLPGDRVSLLAPLIMYNHLIGVLGIESDIPHYAWSTEEIALLEAISNQVSLTLDNARLVEETQLRSEQIRILQEITASAASHVKLDELLDAVTQQLLNGFNLSLCGIALVDGQENSQANTLDHHISQEFSQDSYPRMVAIASTSGSSAPYQIGSNLSENRSSIYQQVYSTYKAMVAYGDGSQPTVLMVPLLTRGVLTGVILMEVEDPGRQFDEDALRLLEQIGLQVSTAIEVAHNFEQTTNRAEHERLIGEMTSRIRETLSVESMVKTAVKEVQQALGLPEVTIRLGLPSTTNRFSTIEDRQ